MPEPLEGVKVVEVARALQGPVAGQYLADMGADVIKVEPALGDPNRRFPPRGAGPESEFGTQFVSANRGKRSPAANAARESPQGSQIPKSVSESLTSYAPSRHC